LFPETFQYSFGPRKRDGEKEYKQARARGIKDIILKRSIHLLKGICTV
jgi:hypothetical protein